MLSISCKLIYILEQKFSNRCTLMSIGDDEVLTKHHKFCENICLIYVLFILGNCIFNGYKHDNYVTVRNV